MTASADDYIPPDLIRISTPRYSVSFDSFTPRLGTYEYTVGWEGIPAASCSVQIRKSGDQFIIDSSARTFSAVDLLYKLRYEAIGTLSARDLSPISLFIDHQENSRIKNIDLTFSPDSKQITSVRYKGIGDLDKKILTFDPKNGMLDPVAAVFLARSLSWKVGDTHHFDVFNGKSRYLISLRAVEETSIEHLGEKREVLVISPFVRNLTTTRPIAKLREARIYVTNDKHRDVLKIVSSVFIGSVITQLVSFSPEIKPDNAEELTIAHASRGESVRAQMR